MLVFVLHHVHRSELDSDAKLLGVYSTRAAADQAIQRYLRRPGFTEHPDGFVVDEHTLDEDGWVEGFVAVTNDVE